MTPDKTLTRMWDLLDKAQIVATPPYKRHPAARLAKVHAIHLEIRRLMLGIVQQDEHTQELYRLNQSPGSK